jgi:uncharacterized DUF497 family protein
MTYILGVLFEWDEAKSAANYELRGFDFGYAALVFRDPFRLDWRDDRRDYGEVRRQTIGAIDSLTYPCRLYPAAQSNSDHIRTKGRTG